VTHVAFFVFVILMMDILGIEAVVLFIAGCGV
jgi:hypothetical protein